MVSRLGGGPLSTQPRPEDLHDLRDDRHGGDVLPQRLLEAGREVVLQQDDARALGLHERAEPAAEWS